jgi:thiol-disulfide isomerase/thioredoxin
MSSLEYDEITKTADIVVLQFTAAWCGACTKTRPHVIQLQKKYSQQQPDKGSSGKIVKFCITDESEELVERFGVSKLPSFAVQINGHVQLVTDVLKLVDVLGAAVPTAAQGNQHPQQQEHSPIQEKTEEAAEDGDPRVNPNPMGNCPMKASAEKFQIAKDFGAKHPILIRQLETLLQENGCAISGIEIVFDADGRPFVIDVNTCNTNYNRAAEAAAGLPLVGSKAIAAFLQTELGTVSNRLASGSV